MDPARLLLDLLYIGESQMKTQVSILLVGIGGYANYVVEELLNKSEREKVLIDGVVDPYPESCRSLSEIKRNNIPVYTTIEQAYGVNIPDIAVISSPINFHCYQTCFALSQGSNVLCEKPISATVQDALKMIKVKNNMGKILSIGYQWSFSKAIQTLKEDISKGLFGKATRLRTLALVPRDHQYYGRRWAGKYADSEGNLILDSVANNATSHYLHNMFFTLGDKYNTSVKPKSVIAELYRANNIQTFDTAAMRAWTEDDVEILFIVSHAVKEAIGPTFCFEFEKAKIICGNFEENGKDNNIIAIFDDGTIKDYGNPNEEHFRKLWYTIDAIRYGKDTLCGPEAAMSQTICLNGAHESMEEISEFPQNIVRYDEIKEMTWVQGLAEGLKKCYKDWKLPSELDIPWAKGDQEINLVGYDYFSSKYDNK